MKRIHGFVLLALSVANCDSKSIDFNFKEVPVNDLPRSIGCASGAPLFQFTWMDKSGKHFLLGCSLVEKYNGRTPLKYEIEVKQLITKSSGSPKIEWKIRDFSNSDSSGLAFNNSSIGVFDFDNDSIADSRFLYELSNGDEPRAYKYMAHIKNVKYVMRGEIPNGFDEESDCSFSWDPSIDKISESAQAALRESATEVLKKIYGCFYGKD